MNLLHEETRFGGKAGAGGRAIAVLYELFADEIMARSAIYFHCEAPRPVPLRRIVVPLFVDPTIPLLASFFPVSHRASARSPFFSSFDFSFFHGCSFLLREGDGV